MKKGFTLIELMVVIAIIGILTAIALPRFADITHSARVAQVQGNLANLRTTIGMFHAKTGSYPTYEEVGKLSKSDNGPDISPEGDLSEKLAEFYSKSIMPTTPAGTIKVGEEDGNPIAESNKVVSERSNDGGWLYIEDRGDIYANLIDGNYTGNPKTEIWQEERIDDGGGENPDGPDVPTGPGDWGDFIDQDNVFKEGSNGYGDITFNQGDSGSTITPSEWHNDWEKVYVYDKDGNIIPNPNSEDGSYNYGDPVPVEDNNTNDYVAILEKTDPATGEKIYLYSDPK